MNNEEAIKLAVNAAVLVGLSLVTAIYVHKREADRRQAIVSLRGELKEVIESESYKAASFIEKDNILGAYKAQLKKI